MSKTDHATRQHERDRGQWDAPRFEALRCLTIYQSAELRPRRAWAYLPLGYDVERTTALLADAAVETEADRDDVHRQNLDFLKHRRAMVERSFERWQAGEAEVTAAVC